MRVYVHCLDEKFTVTVHADSNRRIVVNNGYADLLTAGTSGLAVCTAHHLQGRMLLEPDEDGFIGYLTGDINGSRFELKVHEDSAKDSLTDLKKK